METFDEFSKRNYSLEGTAIPDGEYDALMSGYSLNVILPDGSKSPTYKMKNGVRGRDCKMKVEIKDGTIYIN